MGTGARRLSRRFTRTRPAVGSSSPAIIRIVVDFPAPFGPRKPVTMPGRTVTVSPSTASVRPYRLVTASISITRSTLGARAPPAHQPGDQTRVCLPA